MKEVPLGMTSFLIQRLETLCFECWDGDEYYEKEIPQKY